MGKEKTFMVVYKGTCRTYQYAGKKFSDRLRSVLVTDEEVVNFQGMSDFDVIPLKPFSVEAENEDSGDADNKDSGEDVNVGNEGNTDSADQADIEKEQRSKLAKLTVEQLREMCKNKDLSIDGKKEELIDRIINSVKE